MLPLSTSFSRVRFFAPFAARPLDDGDDDRLSANGRVFLARGPADGFHDPPDKAAMARAASSLSSSSTLTVQPPAPLLGIFNHEKAIEKSRIQSKYSNNSNDKNKINIANERRRRRLLRSQIGNSRHKRRRNAHFVFSFVFVRPQIKVSTNENNDRMKRIRGSLQT